MLRARNRVGAKADREQGWMYREWGHGNVLSIDALSHPTRLVPRSCSAATEKLNFACAYWEDLSQPWFCCVEKKKREFPRLCGIIAFVICVK